MPPPGRREIFCHFTGPSTQRKRKVTRERRSGGRHSRRSASQPACQRLHRRRRAVGRASAARAERSEPTGGAAGWRAETSGARSAHSVRPGDAGAEPAGGRRCRRVSGTSGSRPAYGAPRADVGAGRASGATDGRAARASVGGARPANAEPAGRRARRRRARGEVTGERGRPPGGARRVQALTEVRAPERGALGGARSASRTGRETGRKRRRDAFFSCNGRLRTLQ
jgi:hypothetical protein